MRTVALGDVCHVTTGQSAPQEAEAFGRTGTPFVRAGSLVRLCDGESEDSLELVSPQQAKRFRLKLFPENTVVFPKSGMSAKVGRVYRLRRACHVVSHLAAVLPSDEVDPSYLHRWFEYSPPSRLIENDAYPSIKTSILQRIEIPLPPLREQRRIAAILDKADALRAKRRAAIAKIDQLLQSVFLDMFGEPMTNPKGWHKKTLGELSNGRLRNGLSPSNNGEVPGEVLTLSAITRGQFDFESRREANFDRSPTADQFLGEQTFLICRGNGNGSLVGAGVFPDRSSDIVCFPDTMIGATIDPAVIAKDFLVHIWRSHAVREQITRGARTTNGTYKINQQLLSSISLPVPPREDQENFQRVSRTLNQNRWLNFEQSDCMGQMLSVLQQRAFSSQSWTVG